MTSPLRHKYRPTLLFAEEERIMSLTEEQETYQFVLEHGFAGGHVPAEMPDSYKHGTGLGIEEQKILRLEKSDTVEVVLKKTDSGFGL